MKTVLLDKFNVEINDGDRIKVFAHLERYPGMYHYGIYKVSFDPIRGMTLEFEGLVLEDNEINKNNQEIGTHYLRINEHIVLWTALWRWGRDTDNDKVFNRFNIEGKTFVQIVPTNNIEKIID